MGTHVQRAHELRGLPDTFGAGVCVLDANNDLWSDLLILSGSGSTRHYGRRNWWSRTTASAVYLNSKSALPIPVELEHPRNERANTQGCAVGDLDGDGHEDLVITTTGRDQVWRNDGNGGFELMSGSLQPARDEWTTGVTLVDVNRDGLLDLYIAGFVDYGQNARVYEHEAGFRLPGSPSFDPSSFDAVSSRLYINEGGFRWRDATVEAGLENLAGRTLSTYSLDVNDDNWPDLVEINTGGSGNRVFLNDGSGSFRVEEDMQELVDSHGIQSMAVADLDGNTIPDLVFGTISSYPAIVKMNLSDNVTWMDQTRVESTFGGSNWSIAANDFNNNGSTDVYFGNGFLRRHTDAPSAPLGQPDFLLMRTEGGWYRSDGGVGPSLVKSTRSAVTLDYNNDGAIDFHVTHNNAAAHLLRGEAAGRDWLQILPIDKYGHKGRVSRITLRIGDWSRSYFHGHARNHLGMNDRRFHFGLDIGKAESIEAEILWNEGARTVINDLRPNRLHLIAQSGANCTIEDPSTIPEGCPGDFGMPPENIEEPVERDFNTPSPNDLRHVVMQKGDGSDEEVPFEALVGRESDESVYWLIHNLSSGHRICSTAATLSHYFEEEEAAVRMKFTAINHLAAALEGATDREKACMLRALGKSEHYRARDAIVGELEDVSLLVRRAAVIALGDLDQRAVLERLAQLVSEAPIVVAAESVISMERIAPGSAIDETRRRVASMEPRAHDLFHSALIAANEKRPVFREDHTLLLQEND